MSVVPIVRRPSSTVGVRTAIDRHHRHVSVVKTCDVAKEKKKKARLQEVLSVFRTYWTGLWVHALQVFIVGPLHHRQATGALWGKKKCKKEVRLDAHYSITPFRRVRKEG
jgi:hypothetical protein